MSGMSVVKYQPKRKSDTQSAIDAYNEIVPPMDFSFCRIVNIADATEEEPRPPPPSPRKQQQQQHEDDQSSKSSGKCLKLNNNSITNLECLIPFAQEKFADWQCIAWIDFSHNELAKLGPELTEFVNLRILYLHGNQIQDPAQIDQLIPLKNLRKLTLHGNPLERINGYRWLILSKLPQLNSLDFSAATKADRVTTRTWDKMNCWGAKKKKKQVEED
ncbi:hypothetical protein ACF0H5_011035 [Mactra antiquata]